MGTIISVLILIIAILLILVVLVQNPKGGLASNFSSSNQVMGVRKTTDFIEKATWTLAIALVVLSVVSATFNENTTVSVEPTESELTNEAKLSFQQSKLHCCKTILLLLIMQKMFLLKKQNKKIENKSYFKVSECHILTLFLCPKFIYSVNF